MGLFSDVINVGGKFASDYFGSQANKKANRDTLANQNAFNERNLALASGPRKDAFGNVISATDVKIDPSYQPIIDAISKSGGIANDAFKSFNTSGFFGGQEDASNPFSRTNATNTINADDQRKKDAYINPALDRFVLADTRRGNDTNKGARLQDEVNRLDAQYDIGNEQDILDLIIKNTLGIGNAQLGTVNAAQASVPKPGVDNGVTQLLNTLQRPGAVSPDMTVASIANLGGLGAVLNRDSAQTREDAQRKEVLDILRRQLNQSNQQSQVNNQQVNQLPPELLDLLTRSQILQ